MTVGLDIANPAVDPPTASSTPAAGRPIITASKAHELLESLRGVQFSDTVHYHLVHDVLTQLSMWDKTEHDEDLAVKWIVRIYNGIKKLPRDNSNSLYGKGLRRLRTLCGRTSRVPPMFELPGGDYVRDPLTPQCGTAISDVYKGKNVATTQLVAIKVLRMISNNDNEPDKYKRMFRKEAIVWRLLEHRYIVPFYGILGGSSAVELVSEWMEHGRLDRYLKDNVNQSPLPFLQQIIEGLEHIHALGLAHGDIKGENILLDSMYNARIADFGMNVALQYTGLPTSGGSGGTTAYKAPEIIDDGSPHMQEDNAYIPTRKSDIFAISVLIWELFARERPYAGVSELVIANRTLRGERLLREKCRDLSTPQMDSLWVAVERGWHQDPNQRCELSEMDGAIKKLQG